MDSASAALERAEREVIRAEATSFLGALAHESPSDRETCGIRSRQRLLVSQAGIWAFRFRNFVCEHLGPLDCRGRVDEDLHTVVMGASAPGVRSRS